MRALTVFATTALLAVIGSAQARAVDACVPAAAALHSVNEAMLRAILAVESRFKADSVSRNSDGSVDVGAAGVNSVHFQELARVGVAPQDLLDPCKSAYVAAWLVSRHLARYGNTWFGYAAYHSKTPYYNHRYQILLANELVKAGVLPGRTMAVPPLRPAAPPSRPR